MFFDAISSSVVFDMFLSAQLVFFFFSFLKFKFKFKSFIFFGRILGEPYFTLSFLFQLNFYFDE